MQTCQEHDVFGGICHSGRTTDQFWPPGIFRMHLRLSITRMFFHFTPIEVQPPWSGIKSMPSSAAARHSFSSLSEATTTAFTANVLFILHEAPHVWADSRMILRTAIYRVCGISSTAWHAFQFYFFFALSL